MAKNSCFERLDFSGRICNESISEVKFWIHSNRKGLTPLSGGVQDDFSVNGIFLPFTLYLKKYLIFSFLANNLAASRIGGLVIFGLGTNVNPFARVSR